MPVLAYFVTVHQQNAGYKVYKLNRSEKPWFQGRYDVTPHTIDRKPRRIRNVADSSAVKLFQIISRPALPLSQYSLWEGWAILWGSRSDTLCSRALFERMHPFQSNFRIKRMQTLIV